ncbi:MAG: PP2C family serine/threonine-protein phosphatase [Mollicutes bacterium]|nr:MAG: PP2C family serine/threonine-protein phosphatase [Mollicutes bacterium]
MQNSVSNFRNCNLDITHFLIENGYLLFSTDGFHDFVSFNEMSQILNREKMTEHEKIQILFDKVIYSGSTDDITLLLVKIDGVKI